MFSIAPRDSLLIDLEEPGIRDAFREFLEGAREWRSVPLDEVEALLAEAESSVDAEELQAAEWMFRRVLWCLARCDGGLERKREIARRCAEQLQVIRPKVGKPPYLQFADVRKSGVVHMYHFEISKRAERNRLVRVVAGRVAWHDWSSSGELSGPRETFAPRRMIRRMERELPILRAAPKNAPCPCGSGRKYKNCCGRMIAKF